MIAYCLVGFRHPTFTFCTHGPMSLTLFGSLSGMLLGWLMGFLSLFLILLILIQRGKGGGLSGALGGPGGQSAFGSKAGDTFTVITVVVAAIWGFTCAFTMWLLGTHAPPTSITDSSISPGPGDENSASGNELVIPPMDGGAASGLSSGIDLSGLESIDSDAAESESVEMVPADGAAATEAEADAVAEPAETDAPDSETQP